MVGWILFAILLIVATYRYFFITIPREWNKDSTCDGELLIEATALMNQALYRYNAMVNRHNIPDRYGVGETFQEINEFLDDLPDDVIDEMESKTEY